MLPRAALDARWLACLLTLLTLLVSSPALAGRPDEPDKQRGARKGKRQQAPGPVQVRLSIPDPTDRYVHVRMQVADAPAARTSLAMPAWAPGSYLIRDFGRHVYELSAHDLQGRELDVERVDKQTWTIANRKAGFVVDYQVFADELSVRTSYVDDRIALLNGTSIFLYVVGELERAVDLEVVPPSGWAVHTGLDTVSKADDATPRFRAVDYDELADSPLLLGQAEVRRYTVAGATIELVVAAPGGSNANVDRLGRESERVVRAFARMFNGLPLERYVFLVVADPVGGGGLEHHDSTAMIVRPFSFDDEEGYRAAQRLAAHEFFHLWNVKRIHDRVLGPFDYAHETYSDLLWFHEGFTETMESRALLRAGLVTPEQYLDGLADAWSSYVKKPGRNHTPIAQLSRDAWIKAYKPAANHGTTVVSYYEKGNLVGVCLDLELRLRARANQREGSLEGLFRRLWAQRDPSTNEVAITIDDIVAAASAEAGEDMREFFERYVYGTEELPLPQLLERAGFDVGHAAPSGRDAVWSGIRGHTSIDLVEPGSPADLAGLMLGDEVIAVGGARVRTISEANDRIVDAGVDAEVELSLFRRERLEQRVLKTTANPHERWWFELPNANEGDDLELGRLRGEWLLDHVRASGSN